MKLASDLAERDYRFSSARLAIHSAISYGDALRVVEVAKAERFRSTKQILDLTDRFVIAHTADTENRDPIYDQEATV